MKDITTANNWDLHEAGQTTPEIREHVELEHWKIALNANVTSSPEKQATLGLVLCYKYYPILSNVLHLIFALSLVSLVLTLFGVRVISAYLTVGLLISTSGLSTVLIMASRDIEHGETERNP